ncbi:MAG: formylglycine-generating enzyme family protein, partial [Planctomycetota bacterium JB042]
PELGLRALATAEGVRPATIERVLALSDEVEERRGVFLSLAEKVGDVERALDLLETIRRRTRNGNDLWFVGEALDRISWVHPDYAAEARRRAERLFDHISAPDEAIFEAVPTATGPVPFWRTIPKGTFKMGGPDEEMDDDSPLPHDVTFTDSFQFATVPVTLRMYRWLDPTKGVGSDDLERPVVNVTWYEASAFCRYLATRCEAARGARLPSEAEWEYACRAGTTTAYESGDETTDLDRVGWYDRNSRGRLHRVGEKPANGFGLHDMHGNVFEWCEDTWHDGYLGAPTDGSAWVNLNSERRVHRGGSFGDSAWFARSAYRNCWPTDLRNDDIGFRPARSIRI